jgi:cytochrome P450 family 135
MYGFWVTETTSTQTALPPPMPPGPGLPDPVQAYLLMQHRPRVMRRLHKRYGDVFSVRMPYGPHGSMVTVVALADPDDIRAVFAGPTSTYHAGEGNSSLLDIMGEHSLLLLDEDQHVRARKLLTPAFTARALDGYRSMVQDLAKAEIDHWSDGQEFAAIQRMQAITLEIILRVVFGVSDQDRLDRPRPLVTRIANLNLIVLLAWRYPRLKAVPPRRGHDAAQRELDQLLYAEIADRRADHTTPHRGDLLSRLLRPSDDGDQLSDPELRDQLITFLLAGHETTATSLAWALHELAHNPEELRRAQQSADNPSPDGDRFLEAVMKEAMRLRPVIFQATRTLTQPTEVAGYLLPAGVVVSPALGLVGVSETLHAAAAEFRPDRFLDANPAPNTWIPFGGGARRCIGAAFSLMESVEIVRELLAVYEIEPVGSRPESLRPRGIINAPSNGSRIRIRARRAT